MGRKSEARPPLNPVLRLTRKPTRESVPGGGKGPEHIKTDRLPQQRQHLADRFQELASSEGRTVDLNGQTLLYVSMFDDSHASSWRPNSLFTRDRSARFVLPYKDGFLIEVDEEYLKVFPSYIAQASTTSELVDISRVENVRPYSAEDMLGGRSASEMWDRAPERDGRRLLLAHMLPMKTRRARDAVAETVLALQKDGTLASPGLPLASFNDLEGLPPAERRAFQRISVRGDRIGRAVREYQSGGRATPSVLVRSPADIKRIAASGAFRRIDPMPQVFGAESSAPVEPERPLIEVLRDAPIVGVVDGGRTAKSYAAAEAWRAVPLVPDHLADQKHGNQVSALIVHGADWNPDLNVQPLVCRIGTAQAVPVKGAEGAPCADELLAYVDALMGAHPETRVWNFSLNTTETCDSDQVSWMGHELSLIIRRHGVLATVSIGNGSDGRMRPPADCEAALTVGGHLTGPHGRAGPPCPISLSGPGPAAMLKPEVSNYSHVQTVGAQLVSGSSFATGLTAALAAHLMDRLVDPSPDMARAVLAHRAKGDRFDPRGGFGSIANAAPPWLCLPNTVTLMWQERLHPGVAYYWDLPVPPALLVNGKLTGHGSLTAVLNPAPLTDNDADASYFGVRLNTALQYPRARGWGNLLGSLDTDQIAEDAARRVHHKWSPIRYHEKDFGTRGLSIAGDMLRVYSRLYTRDLYAFKHNHQDELEGFDVAFALTLRSRGPSDLYDEYVVSLGNDVELGVIEADIEV